MSRFHLHHGERSETLQLGEHHFLRNVLADSILCLSKSKFHGSVQRCWTFTCHLFQAGLPANCTFTCQLTLAHLHAGSVHCLTILVQKVARVTAKGCTRGAALLIILRHGVLYNPGWDSSGLSCNHQSVTAFRWRFYGAYAAVGRRSDNRALLVMTVSIVAVSAPLRSYAGPGADRQVLRCRLLCQSRPSVS